MSWFLGAGMGFLFGGPLGAMVGGVLQHAFTQPNNERMMSMQGNKVNQEAVFITNLAVIMTRVAMADGFISQEEVMVIHNFFAERLGYRGMELKYIDGIIRETERVKPDLAQVCTAFRAHANPEIRLLLLDMTYQIASTDQKITPEEQREIDRIAALIGILPEDHQRIRTKYFSDQEKRQSSYSILGLSEGATPDEIKKAYRIMAAQYHPDKVSHLGKELIEFANNKFAEINKAYEDLKKRKRL